MKIKSAYIRSIFIFLLVLLLFITASPKLSVSGNLYNDAWVLEYQNMVQTDSADNYVPTLYKNDSAFSNSRRFPFKYSRIGPMLPLPSAQDFPGYVRRTLGVFGIIISAYFHGKTLRQHRAAYHDPADMPRRPQLPDRFRHAPQGGRHQRAEPNELNVFPDGRFHHLLRRDVPAQV